MDTVRPTPLADVRDVEVAAGVRLRVRLWGGDGGPAGTPLPPFVLVHGLSSNARLWDEVAAVLCGAGHRVAAIDLRSHGDSDAPPDGYDTTTAAEDVAAVCTALGLAPAVLVGQSWGGNVVARVAARHPQLVAALGLIDGGWIDLAADFDTWPACAAALRPPDVDGLSARALRQHLATAHPDWSEAAVAATAANLRELPDGTVRRRLSIDNHMHILHSMWESPPWEDLSAVTVPAVLLAAVPAAAPNTVATNAPAGERDGKRAAVARAASLLPRARVREYVGGDHDLHAQQPGAVAADLLALAREL